MKIEVQLTREPIASAIGIPASETGGAGAWVEFRGIVRGEENGQTIVALEYEAYEAMALAEMRKTIARLGETHPFARVVVIHRIGIVSAGETAIYVGVAATHRGPAFALLSEFMDLLKQNVPIWKTRAIAAEIPEVSSR